ncbi:hypothetical protein CXO80_18185 [Salmonella enterica subsp. enterica serovar Corvallis]|nr:hypothetical protein [Salmonella enterica subsp. enterica serovar Corvallis]
MNKITVASCRHDPKSWDYKIFNNAPDTRPVRTTQPDINKLTTLAAWLVATLPDGAHIHGTEITSQRIFCYSGLTEKERLLKEAKTQRRRNYVEKIIRCYGESLDRPERIDWLFPVIQPNETDEQYWNRAAQEIKNAGAVKIAIQKSGYSTQQLILTIE